MVSLTGIDIHSFHPSAFRPAGVLIFKLILFILLCNNTLTAQWEMLPLPEGQYMMSFDFSDELNGLSVQFTGPGSPDIYKTTDGGASWVMCYDIPVIYYTTNVHCYNRDTAFAGSYGYISRTTDGGVNWTDYYTGRITNAFGFLNGSYGFAGKHEGKYLKTTNGGESWVSLNANLAAAGNQILVFDSTNIMIPGIISGIQPSGIMYRSTNGGSYWLTNEITPPLQRVSFIDSLYGFAIYQYGLISKTTDGGYSWSNHYRAGIFSDVAMMDSSNITVVGNGGLILRSTDAGASWFTVPSGTTVDLKQVKFIDKNHGFISSDLFLLRTTNGGLTFVQDENPGTPHGYQLMQNYPNPFNPSTTINYSLPKYSKVTIRIFNVLGQEITTLINNEEPAGWYNIVWNAGDLASGVYICQLSADSFTYLKKMILIK
jgi:photosystem II stability/assembly factor-like uncharacterized protein